MELLYIIGGLGVFVFLDKFLISYAKRVILWIRIRRMVKRIKKNKEISEIARKLLSGLDEITTKWIKNDKL